MEICFKTKISILDIENLRPLFRKKVDDKVDLLGLVADLSIAIKERRRIRVYLRAEKIWIEGILGNAFIEYINSESSILDLSFLGTSETKQISLANNAVNL